MSALPFTAKELRKAWRELKYAALPSGATRTSPHRLLLFYAVECGLKAIWLKNNNKSVLDTQDIDELGHDLRQLIHDLRLGKDYFLPDNIRLKPCIINNQDHPRNGKIAVLHQAWRYGGICIEPTDTQCEQQLQKIAQWIEKELP